MYSLHVDQPHLAIQEVLARAQAELAARRQAATPGSAHSANTAPPAPSYSFAAPSAAAEASAAAPATRVDCPAMLWHGLTHISDSTVPLLHGMDMAGLHRSLHIHKVSGC